VKWPKAGERNSRSHIGQTTGLCAIRRLYAVHCSLKAVTAFKRCAIDRELIADSRISSPCESDVFAVAEHNLELGTARAAPAASQSRTIDMSVAWDVPSQGSNALNFDLNDQSVSVRNLHCRRTSVLKGSSLTQTQVRAGLGSGITSRTVRTDQSGMLPLWETATHRHCSSRRNLACL
jgi:hypothetical protein